MGLSGVVVGIAIGNHQSASLSGALVLVAVGSGLGPVRILGRIFWVRSGPSLVSILGENGSGLGPVKILGVYDEDKA